MTDKDREIIMRRYFENETQSQIAADLNISQVQVSRLEKKDSSPNARISELIIMHTNAKEK